MKPIQNKAGKTNPLVVMALVFIVAIAAVVYMASSRPATLSTTGDVPTTTSPTGVLAACNYAPTVAVTGTNALVASTTATPTTVNYIVNGQYLGTTAPAVKQGDSWSLVGDLTGYLAGQASRTIDCSGNPVNFKLLAYANATVTFKNDPVVNSNTLTAGGGANNATKAAAGGQLNFPVIFQGTSQKSTSDILWIFESSANNASSVQSVAVTCNGQTLSPTAIPAGATGSNANSFRTAFIVPAILNGAQTNCNLQIVNTPTAQVSGTLHNTFYAQQTFVNSDGQIVSGAFDSSANGNNAAKYQDTYTYNIVVA